MLFQFTEPVHGREVREKRKAGLNGTSTLLSNHFRVFGSSHFVFTGQKVHMMKYDFPTTGPESVKLYRL